MIILWYLDYNNRFNRLYTMYMCVFPYLVFYMIKVIFNFILPFYDIKNLIYKKF